MRLSAAVLVVAQGLVVLEVWDATTPEGQQQEEEEEAALWERELGARVRWEWKAQRALAPAGGGRGSRRVCRVPT